MNIVEHAILLSDPLQNQIYFDKAIHFLHNEKNLAI